MHEFDSVSVSSYEASSLAGKLTEKSGEGWDVVAIVPSGTEITAFLKRESRADSTTSTDAAAAGWDSRPTGAVEEPAGWGSTPEQGAAAAGATSSWGSSSGTDTTGGGWGGTQTATPASTTPSVPAGWYADPANRFELRYWDGSAWTEHVSRAGQQYTDPPVA